MRVDGIDYTLDEEIVLDKNVKHDISVTIDRIAVKEGSERRLTDSVEAALKLANGLVVVENAKKTTIYSTKYSCPDCDVSIEELEPRLFSFNNPYGACPECGGLGFRNEIDLKKIIVDENLGVGNGGLAAPSGWNLGSGDIVRSQMKALAKVLDFRSRRRLKTCRSGNSTRFCTALTKESRWIITHAVSAGIHDEIRRYRQQPYAPLSRNDKRRR